jgi:hypothetical protein
MSAFGQTALAFFFVGFFVLVYFLLRYLTTSSGVGPA